MSLIVAFQIINIRILHINKLNCCHFFCCTDLACWTPRNSWNQFSKKCWTSWLATRNVRPTTKPRRCRPPPLRPCVWRRYTSPKTPPNSPSYWTNSPWTRASTTPASAWHLHIFRTPSAQWGTWWEHPPTSTASILPISDWTLTLWICWRIRWTPCLTTTCRWWT